MFKQYRIKRLKVRLAGIAAVESRLSRLMDTYDDIPEFLIDRLAIIARERGEVKTRLKILEGQ